MIELDRCRLIDLTTLRRDGRPVVTPVRFALDGARVLVSLREDSGKVKRARANGSVTLACHPEGTPLRGNLRFLDGSEARRAQSVLNRRHRLLWIQRLVTGRRPGQHVLAEITLSAD